MYIYIRILYSMLNVIYYFLLSHFNIYVDIL